MAGIDPNSLQLARSGGDLLVSFANGHTLTLAGQFNNTHPNYDFNVQELRFADGTVWTSINSGVHGAKSNGKVDGVEHAGKSTRDHGLSGNHYPHETGGVLVGYAVEGQQPVVLAVIGPGPAAVHQRHRFNPDHAWQCRRLDELYERSGGVLVYLGDWHTHPDGSPQMSWLDKRTIRAIARHAPAECSQPLMLIGGGSPRHWLWCGHRYRSGRLLGVLIDCEVLELRQFRSADAGFKVDE